MNDPTAALFTPRDLRNYWTYSGWMFGSVLLFMATTILLDGKFIPAALGWLMTAATAVAMIAAMRSYMIFLRNADELLRKVHLESLAFGFGAGVVAMMVYRLCERLGAPKLDVNDGALVMFVTWIAGQWFGARRYATAEEQ